MTDKLGYKKLSMARGIQVIETLLLLHIDQNSYVMKSSTTTLITHSDIT